MFPIQVHIKFLLLCLISIGSIGFDFGRITTTNLNTLLVDDCHYKFVWNPKECSFSPTPFTIIMVDDTDMTKVLLPFFQGIFYSSISKTHDFVSSCRFGQQPIRHNDTIKLAILKFNKFSN